MSRIYTSAEQLIGNTPLLELTNIEKEFSLKARLLAKLELFNPAGSVKDRVALAMINDAEQRELLAKTRDIHAQLGPWPQLGKNDKGQNLTLVDAVADSRRKAGHNKEA